MLNRIKGIVFCLSLCMSTAAAFAQKDGSTVSEKGGHVQVKESVFHSESLNRDMHYLVLFPRDYADGRRFPVLYLLHGLYGDYKNWDTLTHLDNVAAPFSMLIVMPDADNSWYVDSATRPADKFEDYIARDFIAEIDHKYRTVPEKQARAIAGLSMGGYGAIKFALKYPDLFAFAGSLSGAFNAPQNLDDLRPDFRDKLLEVFGPKESHTRSENDVSLLLKGWHGSAYFYLACGSADFFLDANRALAAQFSAQKIPYEYHETPGGHAWEYWDSELIPLLQAVSRSINTTK